MGDGVTLNRRTVLGIGGLTLGSLLAGCTEQGGTLGSTSAGSPSTTETQTDTATAADPTDTPTETATPTPVSGQRIYGQSLSTGGTRVRYEGENTTTRLEDLEREVMTDEAFLNDIGAASDQYEALAVYTDHVGTRVASEDAHDALEYFIHNNIGLDNKNYGFSTDDTRVNQDETSTKRDLTVVRSENMEEGVAILPFGHTTDASEPTHFATLNTSPWFSGDTVSYDKTDFDAQEAATDHYNNGDWDNLEPDTWESMIEDIEASFAYDGETDWLAPTRGFLENADPQEQEWNHRDAYNAAKEELGEDERVRLHYTEDGDLRTEVTTNYEPEDGFAEAPAA